VKNPVFRLERAEALHEGNEYLAQQKPEPPDQAAEVIACGGEDGVGGVTSTIPEIVATHAVLGF